MTRKLGIHKDGQNLSLLKLVFVSKLLGYPSSYFRQCYLLDKAAYMRACETWTVLLVFFLALGTLLYLLVSFTHQLNKSNAEPYKSL